MKTGSFNINMLICFAVAFLVTAVIAPVLIPYLRRLKFGQQILDDGPTWHEKKSGTPTMGGISFIAGALVAVAAALFAEFDIKLLMMVLISTGFGAIGFLDDYIKVVKKRNLGLTASQKFLLQAILAVVYVAVLGMTGELESSIIIPFTDIELGLPWWVYVPFILLVVTGTVNAVNLTDGIDGLASSVTVVTALFFAAAASLVGNFAASHFAFAIVGGCLAFLMYNKYPAKVFMGDTGSLYLGGALSVLAVGMKMPLVLVIAGFVYLFETLSVILQVASFKLTGKRIFKMSPIHHHFEMCGWSEKKIVAVFSLAALVLAVIAYLSIQSFAV
ncbi:MAG: phospho-N-acetylmuramoyl-pentapeptide-transferase [Clostridia bacterium]|nr:phospho-N-acetylmuramoyl-pentapeptide-transferase [Clostridia bacterium]